MVAGLPREGSRADSRSPRGRRAWPTTGRAAHLGDGHFFTVGVSPQTPARSSDHAAQHPGSQVRVEVGGERDEEGEEAAWGDQGSGELTVWSLESQTDRVQATQAVADKFTQQTGVKVKIVATDENQFTQLITSAAAAGELPDVVGALPLAAVAQMATNDLLDTEAAKAVVDELGRDTFSPRALELTTQDGNQLAVPSDGWAQLLFYRKDLFDKAGLAAPDTFDKIRQPRRRSSTPAAWRASRSRPCPTTRSPRRPSRTSRWATTASSSTTRRTSRSTRAQCVETFQLYGDLVENFSVPGAQDVDTTRATYFSGKAAMVVWSSFLLDEMAGLRNDALPTCPECKADPAYLAKNSGIVTAISGPRRPAGAVRRDHQLGDRQDRRRHGERPQVHRVHDERGLHRLAGHRPRGQVPGAQGRQDRPPTSSPPPGTTCRPASTPRSRSARSTRPR